MPQAVKNLLEYIVRAIEFLFDLFGNLKNKKGENDASAEA